MDMSKWPLGKYCVEILKDIAEKHDKLTTFRQKADKYDHEDRDDLP